MSSENDPDNSEATQTVSLDYAEDAVLDYLADKGEPVENLSLVAVAVREYERKQHGREKSEHSIPEVKRALVQTYLPELARDNRIDYNRAEFSVSVAHGTGAETG